MRPVGDGEHYYTARPQSAHRPRRWKTTLRGKELVFITDAGVFSAEGVDRGTRLLIETVELPQEGDVLDLGCGYGVLGIACAVSEPGLRVVMVDINQRALELARQNARLNGAANTEILESDGYQALKGRRFDLILTNPPFRQGKELVSAWLKDGRNYLKPGGRLVMVVRTQQGAHSWRRRLEEWYGHCEELEKGGGYRVFQVRVEG